MDKKTLQTLEFPKILEKLAEYCSFEVSAELARDLKPTSNLIEARRRQAVTAEAFKLLSSHPDTTIGGVRDIRTYAEEAARNVVLETGQLLDIKYTLIAARNLKRIFEKGEEAFPQLYNLALRLPPPLGLVDAISRTVSDRGEVLDSASDKLANIRHDLRIQHDRLLSRMQSMLTNPDIAPYLQDNLVTQRDGRYVIPLRADFKGKIKAVIHDSSSSGATLFVEPLSVVEANNNYRELLLEERDEVRRVLAELSQLVGEYASLLIDMVNVIAGLDFALACAKYAEDINAFEPALLPFRDSKEKHPGVVIKLQEARHPLLDPSTVVPIDLEFDAQTFALIITGPNTGGKTVTLKTVGLLALMAQSGLHIPSRHGSQISVFKNIFADIGDEQSIEQSLSTFSGHITNIIHILKNADRESLVVLDELGAGTDPQEGAALARALLTHILDRGITTLVTTHHPELKAYAQVTPGVVNASVEFDLQSLKPTFHLTIGLPGRSNAVAIAERLGLPEKIISSARAEINPVDLRAEDLLDEIHRQRDLAREALQEADNSRREAESLRLELASRLDNVEDERLELLQQARAEAEQDVEVIREELKKISKELKHHRQPIEAIKQVEEQIRGLEETVEKPIKRRIPEITPIDGPIQLGSKVQLRTLGNQGVVSALGEEEAEVQIGMLRIRARLSELELVSNKVENGDSASEPIRESRDISIRHESPGLELDLRGRRADDALDILEGYIEKAFLAKLPWVRIIHGKGTGKLRDVVREALEQNHHILSFESGKSGEGGDGVTVAKIKD